MHKMIYRDMAPRQLVPYLASRTALSCSLKITHHYPNDNISTAHGTSTIQERPLCVGAVFSRAVYPNSYSRQPSTLVRCADCLSMA